MASERSRNKGFNTLYFVIAFFLFFLPAICLAVSSTSYIIDPSGGEAMRQTTSSTNYQLEGSLEPIVGRPSSTNYLSESGSSFAGYCGDGFIDPTEDCEGANLNSKTCITQGFTGGALSCSVTCTFNTTACASGGGGGEVGGTVKMPPNAPSFDESIVSKSFTYLSQIDFFGYKASNATLVYINNSTEGVSYATASRWQKTLALNLGQNTITIKAANNFGFSGEVSQAIKRRLVGDVNDNNTVDDYDFSLLANHWGQNWPEANFNTDSVVDDYDLSMMGAFWTK